MQLFSNKMEVNIWDCTSIKKIIQMKIKNVNEEEKEKNHQLNREKLNLKEFLFVLEYA